MSEKPNGAKVGWKFLGKETRFENEILRIREDQVEPEAGKKTTYAYMERDEAVIVVPVTEEGEMVLLKQYRYPVDEWCLEVPAGGTHDTGGTPLDDVVKKELREEIGASVRTLRYVDWFYSAPSYTDEKCHVFIAEGVTLSKKQKTEAGEKIKIELVPIEKALELARSGAMRTAQCALAVLLCEPLVANLSKRPVTPDYLLET